MKGVSMKLILSEGREAAIERAEDITLCPSFPGSAWERAARQALPAGCGRAVEGASANDARQSLAGSAFPGRAWEREATSIESNVERGSMVLVEVRNVTKEYRKGEQKITPLKDVNLHVEQGIPAATHVGALLRSRRRDAGPLGVARCRQQQHR